MELNRLLEEYKALTVECINETMNIEKLEDLLNKRQEKIESINNLEFNKEDFVDIANKINIIELEKQLENNIKNECLKTKRAIANVRKLREARRSYIKNDGMPSFIDKAT